MILDAGFVVDEYAVFLDIGRLRLFFCYGSIRWWRVHAARRQQYQSHTAHELRLGPFGADWNLYD